MTETRRELLLAALVLVVPIALVSWATRVARAQASAAEDPWHPVDEFEETFELAGPGKPFEVYSRSRLRRAS
jgi:hypothetical protein